jgi:hypothetical protein
MTAGSGAGGILSRSRQAPAPSARRREKHMTDLQIIITCACLLVASFIAGRAWVTTWPEIKGGRHGNKRHNSN